MDPKLLRSNRLPPLLLDVFRQDSSEDAFLTGNRLVSHLYRMSLFNETYSAEGGGQNSGHEFLEDSTETQHRNGHNELALVHIPRTGGTTLENTCTKTVPGNNRWGSLNKDIHGLKNLESFGAPKNAGGCYGQHVPSLMPQPYQNKTTFCVVRDPHDRMISQFGFAMAFYNVGQRCDKDTLNKYLNNSLSEVLQSHRPYIQDCHFLPQAAFSHGRTSSNEIGDRVDPARPWRGRCQAGGVSVDE